MVHVSSIFSTGQPVFKPRALFAFSAAEDAEVQPAIPHAILATMLDHLREKQREDLETFARNIRAHIEVECADLKNELTRVKAELVDLRLQYQRMQNLR